MRFEDRKFSDCGIRVEGKGSDWHDRVGIIEFATRKRLNRRFSSEEYGKIVPWREWCAESRAIIKENNRDAEQAHRLEFLGKPLAVKCVGGCEPIKGQ